MCVQDVAQLLVALHLDRRRSAREERRTRALHPLQHGRVRHGKWLCEISVWTSAQPMDREGG